MMRRMLVAALVLGSLGCDTEAEKAEQAEKQRQEQEFVIAVGRSPSPDKINAAGRRDLHIVARLNLHMLAISLLEQGANANVKDNDGWTPLHWALKGMPPQPPRPYSSTVPTSTPKTMTAGRRYTGP